MELSGPQRTELRQDLEALARTLRDALDNSAEAAAPVELDQPAIGRVSRIGAIAQQKMLEASREAQRAQLQLVRSALLRFDDDDFGECLGCGESIGYRRLKARPESIFCIACQSAREHR